MRLESVRSPDLVHRRRRDASPRRHRAFAPVGGVRRLVIERQVHDLLDFPRRQGLAPGRAGGVLQQPVRPGTVSRATSALIAKPKNSKPSWPRRIASARSRCTEKLDTMAMLAFTEWPSGTQASDLMMP